ncbi:LPS-assembly protein LptD [Phenylobacterium kunshanense]|uniref:LPS-assembly protein LptD n=1 Tax=Phenylobacterium kunshanense TaxID=1445034 RepID=A0A328BNI1_9CAUL|nr:LPS-assembly protein LptD [Phenylobacterium kunshanense]RAK68653.1 LPS-assembly protein LptD [Phenylobacterium kunshanense]
MSPRRRPPRSAGKRALLAGAALALLCATQALAQPGQPAATPDGLQPDEMYMEADEVIREDDAGITTAQGNIEIRYDGRTLRANKLVYNDQTGVIRAYGDITVVNSDGTFEFAQEMVLDDKMRAGVALGFSARLQENVKIAAASVARRSETIEELNKAIYTPCETCAADGSPKTPTWSVAAERVVRDKKRRIVYYRNARFRLFGVSVAYLPVFWHADPAADRSSGFLVPKASVSDRRGLSYEQPYYWVVSPSTDLTISPQINTKIAPFLNGQVRKRFYSGDVDVRFGYTHARDFDGKGNELVGTKTDRSYILGRGSFQIDEKWLWGFTAERASDDLIFDKYEIGKVYISRGPYVADDRRLISQLYTIRQDERSYFSAAAMTIQGLRPGSIDPVTGFASGENDRVFPIIGPLIEGHYEPAPKIAGGRLRAHTSAVVLSREQSQSDLTQRLPGLDSARVTGELDWRRSFTSAGGLRVSPFVNVRADAYAIRDILTGVGSATRKDDMTRGLATAGVDISYPLFKRTSDATIVLEPVAQVAASPDAKQIVIGRTAAGDPVYLNEDSVAFEFDETTLFRPNKFPGYDLYEDGVRLNLAGRATVLWDDGRRANLLVGRSFRTEENAIFTNRSGLRTKTSDWIVAADVQPIRGLSMFARARLDNDNFDIHRLEAGANAYNKYGSGFVRYLTDDFDINGVKRENLDLGGEVYLGKNFGVSVYGNRDLQQDSWVIRDVGVFYRDDCLRVDVIYRREDTILGRLLPSESVSVRLTLATLGGSFNDR